MLTRDDTETITNMISNSMKQLIENKEFIGLIVKQVSCAVEQVFLNKIAALEDEIKKLKRESSDMKKAHFVEDNFDRLEQYTRRNNVRIFGLPEESKENVDDVVVALCRDKLNVNISVNDIDRYHRVGVPKNNSNRPIIVKFVSYRARHQVFMAKRKLKNSGITIREDLTKSRLSLLKAATDKFTFHNVWTSDGRIILNHESNGKFSKIVINNIEQLNKIN